MKSATKLKLSAMRGLLLLLGMLWLCVAAHAAADPEPEAPAETGEVKPLTIACDVSTVRRYCTESCGPGQHCHSCATAAHCILFSVQFLSFYVYLIRPLTHLLVPCGCTPFTWVLCVLLLTWYTLPCSCQCQHHRWSHRLVACCAH